MGLGDVARDIMKRQVKAMHGSVVHSKLWALVLLLSKLVKGAGRRASLLSLDFPMSGDTGGI